MIESYEQLRDEALELENLLFQKIIVDTKKQALNASKSREDKNTNNPFIRNLQLNQKNELETIKKKQESILAQIKAKFNAFSESVNQFIQSEYEKYAPFYNKSENISEEKKEEDSYGHNKTSIDMKLKILYDIENYIIKCKIYLSEGRWGRWITDWNNKMYKDFAGEIYKELVYSLKDITKNDDTEKKAEELFSDAIKYIAIENQEELNKSVFNAKPKYISTPMLAEYFPNTNLDVIVSLKNMLIDSGVLYTNGTTNLLSDELHSAHNFLKNNTTEQHDDEKVELMPFFGVDCSKSGTSHTGKGPDLIPINRRIDDNTER